MKIATVSARRQITLAKAELDAIGLKPGDAVLKQFINDGSITISPVRTQSIKNKKGGDKS
jgi:bifunctional DNA-binding transcriptional regulator/antitoxin component of YhaV-PrlF toxin-antitoxin module